MTLQYASAATGAKYVGLRSSHTEDYEPRFSLQLISVPIRPSHPLEIAPILLGRPPAIVARNRSRDSHLELRRFARPSPLFALLVKLCRDRRRPPILRESAHRYDVIVRSDADSQRIANLQLFGSLGPLAIDFDLSRFDCRRGERSRLQESGCPQPLVEPYLHCIAWTHFSLPVTMLLSRER